MCYFISKPFHFLLGIPQAIRHGSGSIQTGFGQHIQGDSRK